MWQNELGKEGEQQQQHLVALQPASSHQQKHNTTYAKKSKFLLRNTPTTWHQQSKASSP
jgi:hypothetical protein